MDAKWKATLRQHALQIAEKEHAKDEQAQILYKIIDEAGKKVVEYLEQYIPEELRDEKTTD